jgi:multisubunit Na+/H+ antiporter MnhC subunit
MFLAAPAPLLGFLVTEPVSVAHYLVVGAILFTAGVACMAIKRNALGVLMGIELVLNGANMNFVAFASPSLQASGARSRGSGPAGDSLISPLLP